MRKNKEIFRGKKVLVIVPNWIGDALMVTPLLRFLKEELEARQLNVLARERTQEVFFYNPYVDNIIPVKNKSRLLSIPLIIKQRGNFDMAVLLKPSFTKSFFCKLIAAEFIVSFDSSKFNFSDVIVPFPEGKLHKIDYYLRIAEGFGLSAKKRSPEYFISPKESKEAVRFLWEVPDNKPIVVFHAKANWLPKMWPVEYFAWLGDKLIEELGASIVLTGSSEDKSLVNKISDNMAYKPFDFSGKTNLRQIAAVLSKCSLFISGDTGIMHLAAAVDVPLIAIFGPTSPEVSGPRGRAPREVLFENKNCEVPCYDYSCNDYKCIKDILPQKVFSRVKKILA